MKRSLTQAQYNAEKEVPVHSLRALLARGECSYRDIGQTCLNQFAETSPTMHMLRTAISTFGHVANASRHTKAMLVAAVQIMVINKFCALLQSNTVTSYTGIRRQSILVNTAPTGLSQEFCSKRYCCARTHGTLQVHPHHEATQNACPYREHHDCATIFFEFAGDRANAIHLETQKLLPVSKRRDELLYYANAPHV